MQHVQKGKAFKEIYRHTQFAATQERTHFFPESVGKHEKKIVCTRRIWGMIPLIRHDMLKFKIFDDTAEALESLVKFSTARCMQIYLSDGYTCIHTAFNNTKLIQKSFKLSNGLTFKYLLSFKFLSSFASITLKASGNLSMHRNLFCHKKISLRKRWRQKTSPLWYKNWGSSEIKKKKFLGKCEKNCSPHKSSVRSNRLRFPRRLPAISMSASVKTALKCQITQLPARLLRTHLAANLSTARNRTRAILTSLCVSQRLARRLRF